ncbi:MAG: thioredoxin family protein [Candidatus Fermentibacteraceae bacterium]|nr:thioredoxin family protein [Candidatus Fermentibacteraceae bacterium]MBN2609895.1 thioredoxin family protein [Candidatus Fermentibacteraceae bacterium]
MMIAVLSCGRTSEEPAVSDTVINEVKDGLPTLLDLGSTSCVPCQMMEGELERLDEMAGDCLVVTFIDINLDRDAASRHGIRVIPTQLFLAPDGTELYRHEGYISAEQMLSQWIALGYDLNEAAEVR